MKLLVCLVKFVSFNLVVASNILIFEPFGSKSHKNVFKVLSYALLEGGHNVTFYTYSTDEVFLQRGGRELIVEDLNFEELLNNFPSFFDLRLNGGWAKFNQIANLGTLTDLVATKVYDSQKLKELMKEDFDLIVHSLLFSDAFLPIIKHWDCPFVYLSPSGMPPGMAHYFGGSEEYATYPGTFTSFTPKMTFLQRVVNFIGGEVMGKMMDHLFFTSGERHAERIGLEYDTFEKMRKNASLVFLNTDVSTHNIRNFPNTVIQVGGMHCRPANFLPMDLQEFVSYSDVDGFIVFGLGSIIKASDMPVEIQKMFLNAFSRLKQRVIWKWETDNFDVIPDNVKLVKWLPQQDLLGHPNIKAFLSHGGLLSIQEAVYHGVPLIGLPLGSDQDVNVAKCVKDGYALSLEWGDISEEKIFDAIQSVVYNPRFSSEELLQSTSTLSIGEMT
ncbi:UDP-glucosyltransferase 2-like isoform X3 [Artemia franciscana]|uniref:UDP-glucuronosyltransferase n=1 Tax=Artemia franciscana TaxID=6661 RepID=A0AA88H775_ARTSF|nr:hypothetical protein QYM36_016204 [Artemia franciscana]